MSDAQTPQDPSARLDALLQKARGAASAVDQDSLEQHLTAHQEDRRLLRSLTEIRAEAGDAFSAEQIDQRALALRTQLHTKRRQGDGRARQGNVSLLGSKVLGGVGFPQRTLRRIVSFGAAVATATIVGVVAIRWGTRSTRETTAYTSRMVEQKTITLPDGSIVRLAPQSRLTVAKGFGEGNRAVELNGEAHFAVIPGSGVPFLVRSAGITSRVLGTEFAVKHFDGDRTVQVAVVSGKVGSSGVRSAAITTAGKITNLTDSTAVTTDVHHQTSYTDWARGQLIFNAAPVSDMLATLGHWYGYEFKWSDAALSTGRVSGTFKVADRADMMVVLSAVLDVTMTVDGKVITLHSRGTMHAAPVKSYEHFTSPTEIGR